jgi:hypothetical protein
MLYYRYSITLSTSASTFDTSMSSAVHTCTFAACMTKDGTALVEDLTQSVETVECCYFASVRQPSRCKIRCSLTQELTRELQLVTGCGGDLDTMC